MWPEAANQGGFFCRASVAVVWLVRVVRPVADVPIVIGGEEMARGPTRSDRTD